MNMLLWVMQGLLALVFLAHGQMLLMPPPEIAAQMHASLPRWFTLFLGIAEVLAFVGLLLPGLTRILPGLVVAAAAGVTIVTASATVYHAIRNEMISAITTFVLLALATFVIYGRLRLEPIAPRPARWQQPRPR